jgi:hypothetical protein
MATTSNPRYSKNKGTPEATRKKVEVPDLENRSSVPSGEKNKAVSVPALKERPAVANPSAARTPPVQNRWDASAAPERVRTSAQELSQRLSQNNPVLNPNRFLSENNSNLQNYTENRNTVAKEEAERKRTTFLAKGSGGSAGIDTSSAAYLNAPTTFKQTILAAQAKELRPIVDVPMSDAFDRRVNEIASNAVQRNLARNNLTIEDIQNGYEASVSTEDGSGALVPKGEALIIDGKAYGPLAQRVAPGDVVTASGGRQYAKPAGDALGVPYEPGLSNRYQREDAARRAAEERILNPGVRPRRVPQAEEKLRYMSGTPAERSFAESVEAPDRIFMDEPAKEIDTGMGAYGYGTLKIPESRARDDGFFRTTAPNYKNVVPKNVEAADEYLTAKYGKEWTGRDRDKRFKLSQADYDIIQAIDKIDELGGFGDYVSQKWESGKIVFGGMTKAADRLAESAKDEWGNANSEAFREYESYRYALANYFDGYEEYLESVDNPIARVVAEAFGETAQQFAMYYRAGPLAAAGATVGGILAGPKGVEIGAKVAGFMSMYKIERGMAYTQYRESGMDHKSAQDQSAVAGLVNAGIELLEIGMLFKGGPRALGAISRSLFGKIPNKFLRGAVSIGTAQAALTGAEVTQEGVQQFVTNLMENVGFSRMEERGVPLPEGYAPMTAGELAGASLEEAKNALPMMTLMSFLGLPGNVSRFNIDETNRAFDFKTRETIESAESLGGSPDMREREPEKYNQTIHDIRTYQNEVNSAVEMGVEIYNLEKYRQTNEMIDEVVRALIGDRKGAELTAEEANYVEERFNPEEYGLGVQPAADFSVPVVPQIAAPPERAALPGPVAGEDGSVINLAGGDAVPRGRSVSGGSIGAIELGGEVALDSLRNPRAARVAEAERAASEANEAALGPAPENDLFSPGFSSPGEIREGDAGTPSGNASARPVIEFENTEPKGGADWASGLRFATTNGTAEVTDANGTLHLRLRTRSGRELYGRIRDYRSVSPEDILAMPELSGQPVLRDGISRFLGGQRSSAAEASSSGVAATEQVPKRTKKMREDLGKSVRRIFQTSVSGTKFDSETKDRVNDITERVASGEVSLEYASRELYNIAGRMFVPQELLGEEAEAVKKVRRAPILIDDDMRTNIPDFNKFRSKNSGVVRLLKTAGVPMDVFYQELSGEYPWLFPENITHPADQLVTMTETVRGLKNFAETTVVGDIMGQEEIYATYVNPSIAEMGAYLNGGKNGVHGDAGESKASGSKRGLADGGEQANAPAPDGRGQAQVQAAKGNLRNGTAREFERNVRIETNAGAENAGVSSSANADFYEQFDAWNGKDTQGYFILGMPTQSLLDAGIPNDTIIMSKGTAVKIMNDHNFERNTIRKLPKMVNDPVLIIESPTRTETPSYVLYGELYDDKGNPIMASLQVKRRKDGAYIEDVNKITSMYARSNTQNYINKNRILYPAQYTKRTLDWARSLGLQLPSGVLNQGSDKNTIHDSSVNVNGPEAKKEKSGSGDATPKAPRKPAGLVLDAAFWKAKLPYKEKRVLRALADISGTRIRFAEASAFVDEEGKAIPANAFYRDGEIVINVDSKLPVRTAVLHELVHNVREQSESEYKTLKNAVLLAMDDAEYQDALIKRFETYGNAGIDYASDSDAITEEVVADALGYVLGDSALAERFATENRTFFQRIMDLLRGMLGAISDRLNGRRGGTRALTDAQKTEFASLASEIEELYAAMRNALEATGGNGRTGGRYSLSGDMTTENKRIVANMDSVANLTGNEFQKSDTPLDRQAEAYFAEFGYSINNSDIGEVAIDRRGAKDSIAHGVGRKKAAAFAAVPYVLRDGRVVAEAENWKGRNYDSFVIAAPITIGNEPHFMGAVVIRRNENQRFYLHEVVTDDGTALPFKTGVVKTDGGSGGQSRSSLVNILRELRDVKRESGNTELSRENIERNRDKLKKYSIAYHGSPYRFDEFLLDHIGDGEGAQAHGWGLYFAADEKTAQKYRENLSGHAMRAEIGDVVYERNKPHDNWMRDGKPVPHIVRAILAAGTNFNGNADGFAEYLKDVRRRNAENLEEWAAIPEMYEEAKEKIAELDHMIEGVRTRFIIDTTPGEVYAVDIPDEDVMLHEDDYLSDQPGKVREALYNAVGEGLFVFQDFMEGNGLPLDQDEAFGYQLYKALKKDLGSARLASALLNEHGIKGIVYNGRQDGKAYVVFDDKAIKILEKASEVLSEGSDGRKFSLSDEGTAERARRILDMEPVKVTPGPALSQKDAEDMARSFGLMENENDGRVARLPVESVGKIIKHKGYPTAQIFSEVPQLYETALPAWSESEEVRKGHKAHNNIAAYHNYVNKFGDGTGEYFIRFTVSESKLGRNRRSNTAENMIHSTSISNVEIYKKSDIHNVTGIIAPGRTDESLSVEDGPRSESGIQVPTKVGQPPSVDTRLQQFFDSVNGETKKFSVKGDTEAERRENVEDAEGGKFYMRPETFITKEMALNDDYPDDLIKYMAKAAEILKNEGKTEKTPLKSEQQMSKELLDRFGIKVGKPLSQKDEAKSKSYAGANVVRLKNHSDLRSAARAAGRVLDERYGLTEKFGDELGKMVEKFEIPEWERKAYKNGNKLKEKALAEFVNLYVTNPDRARELGRIDDRTNFYDLFEKAVGKKDADHLHAVRGDNARFEAASLVEEFKSTMEPIRHRYHLPYNGIDEIWDGFTGKMMYLRTLNVHNFAPLEVAMRRINRILEKKGENRILPNDDLDMLTDQVMSASNKAYSTLTHGITAMEDGNVKLVPSYAEILNPLRTQKDKNSKPELTEETQENFEAYLKALDTIDRLKLGKRVVSERFTMEANEAIKDELERNNPLFKPVAGAVHMWKDALMQEYVVGTGILTQEQYDTMKKMYPHHIPEYRLLNGKKGGRHGKGNPDNPLKRTSKTGSDADTVRPLEAIARQTDAIMNAAAARVLWGKVHYLYTTNPTAREVLSEFITPLEPTKTPPRDAKKFGESNSENEYDEALEEAFDFYAVTHKGKGNGVLSIPIGDKYVNYEIHDDSFRLMVERSGADQLGTLMKTLKTSKNVFTALTTGIDPTFPLQSNVPRDVISSFILGNINHPGVFLAEIVKAGRDVIKNTDMRKLAVSMGTTGHESIVGAEFSSNQRYKLRKALGAKSKRGTGGIGRKIIEMLKAFNNFFETIPRQAQFNYAYRTANKAYGAGVTEFDRMLYAQRQYRRSSSDFQRHGAGDAARFLTGTVPFLGAMIQGTDTVYRALFRDRGRRGKTWAKMLTFYALTAMLTAIFYHDDEDYEREKAYYKDRYHLIKIPGIHDFVRIPKTQEMGTIFGAAFERAFIAAMKGEWGDAFEGWRESVIQQFIPGGFVWSPVTDAINNRTWYDAPMVPANLDTHFKAGEYDKVYDENTSYLGRGLARILPDIKGLGALNTPIGIDYVLSNTGFVGKFGLEALRPGEHDWFNLLFSRNLLDTSKSDKYQGEFYDLKDIYDSRAESMREIAAAEKGHKFGEDEKKDYMISDFLTRVYGGYKGETKAETENSRRRVLSLDDRKPSAPPKVIPKGLSDYSKELRELEASDLPLKERKRRIDALQEERNRLARTAALIVEYGQPTAEHFKNKEDLAYARNLYTFAYLTAKQTPDDGTKKETDSSNSAANRFRRIL